uniref:Putative ovule protein n=1 Tax=Solanum chacoense TaxID=4108 RepID=A0A0V0HLV4_SOLCH
MLFFGPIFNVYGRCIPVYTSFTYQLPSCISTLQPVFRSWASYSSILKPVSPLFAMYTSVYHYIHHAYSPLLGFLETCNLLQPYTLSSLPCSSVSLT